MTLTPEMIRQANQVTGFNVPENPDAPVSRGDELMAAWQRADQGTKKSSIDSGLGENGPQDTGLLDKLKQRGRDIASDFSQAGKTPGSPLKKTLIAARAGSRIAGDIAGGINDVVGQAISPVTEPVINSIKSDPLWQKPEVKKAISTVSSLLGGLAQKHPEITKDLGSLMNVLGVAALPSGIEEAGALGEKVASDVGDLVNAAKGAVSKGAEFAGNVKEAVVPALTPEEATGRLIQGETSDVAAAKRTFQNLEDTTNIRTHTDLSKAIDKQIIKPGLKAVDAEFAKDATLHPIDDFSRTIGEGNSAVTRNSVQDAIDQLKDFYTKTGDTQGLSDIKALEERANTEGLTYGDINKLAREHGSALSAYNANGELASGLSKQAAENTRRGLKEVAREGLGSSEAKALDKEVSEAIDTKDLIDKQVERVNKAIQKNPKVGKIPKKVGPVIKAFAHPVDTISRITGVSGEGVSYTPIELGEQVRKNLGIIRGK